MTRILRIDEPNEKQKMAMMARTRYVGFGGARGGGKSWFVRSKSTTKSLRYKKHRSLIMRQTYPELMRNHVSVLKPMLNGIATYNDKEKQFRFGNGSIIDLQYCQHDRDLERLQGTEYDAIFVDEATNLTEYQIKVINACCRGVNPYPKQIFYTMNPGGPSHQYFKRLFIDKQYLEDEDPNDYTFIAARVQDNVALATMEPEYIKFLKNLPEKLKSAWLEGNWDVFQGQFFETYRDTPKPFEEREYTHVLKPFAPPGNWNYFRSYDYGYNKPFSCAWWAMDFDGTLYRILELYGCTKEPNTGVKWTADQQFAEIARIEREHPWLRGRKITGVADPAIWQSESNGMSIADTAAKHHVLFRKADHDRLNGWMQVRCRMQFDEHGYARLYVFENCEAFRRTIPALQYDTVRPEDLDTDGEDHSCGRRSAVYVHDESRKAAA